MIKPTARYLVAAVVCCFTFTVAANEITQIRFGKTSQRSRLVVESDQPLQVRKLWKANHLVVSISGLTTAPTQERIGAGALGAIKKLNWDDNDSTLNIELTVTPETFSKWFQIERSRKENPRLVIDWLAKGVKKIAVPSRVQATPVESESPSSVQSSSIHTLSTKRLHDDGIRALTDKNYPLAISLLTMLLEKGDDTQKAFALEFLGVARERNYQLAFAKQYYQRFLKEYPDSKKAARVKQRLSALIGIQEINKRKTLKEGTRKRASERSATRGSLATDYRYSQLVNDLGESRETLSLFDVDLDVRGDYRYTESNLKFRFSGGHYQDLTDLGKGTTDRLRYANISWETKDEQFSVDFGRQRSRGKGIFGRFDGAVAGYGVNKEQRLNIFYGAPVASSKIISIDPERTFYGVSYDWEDIFSHTDISLFALNQTIGNLTDRRAVGGEVKYLSQGVSIFSLVDYDIFFSELNAFLFSSSYTTKEKTRYHWSFNQRKSPYISTRNALIGQSADSVAELQNLLITDEEILDLATDRTLESKTSTFQMSKPLNKNYDLSGSVTWMNFSGAPASGGVAAIAEPGAQMYFNLYLRGSRLYSAADSNQLGVRVSKLSTSDVWSIYASSQYRFKNALSISGKLRYDDRKNNNGGGQQNISPSIRLQYQSRDHYLYLDAGAILYTNQVVGLSDINTDIYYVYLGYRYFF